MNGTREYYDKTAREWAERGYTEGSETLSFREFTDGVFLCAGLVHIENQDLPTAFARMAQVLRPGGLLLADVREGMGRIDSLSVSEIDGKTYDRNFIGHSLEDLTAAMGPDLSYLRELSSDRAVWHAYLFRRQ